MNNKREGAVIFSEIEKYAGLKRALEIGRSEILSVVRESGLKGRGGAGFPTGVKWNLVASAKADKKYIVCNADEGEPGTFKDRILLTEYISLILEGMIIGGFAIGANKGFLYLRGEYDSFLPAIEKEIDIFKKDKALGRDIMGKKGFDFDIEIRSGSGAYVCGEETAMIESMEGNRGEPRNRPPFPVNTGYNGYPTSVNNVETLANIPHIAVKGASWFKSIGTPKSAGTKILSVSGDCKRPGVYEVAFGTTIKQVLKMVSAEDTKAVFAGASGGCVSNEKFGRKIAFEDFPTGGSFIIIGKKRNMLDAVSNFLKFFEEESCGQCTPCREGIPVLLEAVDTLKRGDCSSVYLKDILNLAETMQLASKCGLGQSSANALVSVINDFKSEYTLSKTRNKEKAFNG